MRIISPECTKRVSEFTDDDVDDDDLSYCGGSICFLVMQCCVSCQRLICLALKCMEVH